MCRLGLNYNKVSHVLKLVDHLAEFVKVANERISGAAAEVTYQWASLFCKVQQKTRGGASIWTQPVDLNIWNRITLP